MKRADAERTLLGKRVQAMTGLNGDYIGTCIAIDGSPWRATVRVEEITDWPTPTNVGFNSRDASNVRRPFHEGRVIDVDGANCVLHRGPREAYAESAEKAYAKLVAMVERARTDPRTNPIIFRWPEQARPFIERIRAGDYCDCRCHTHPAPDKYRASFLQHPVNPTPCCPHGAATPEVSSP